MKKTIIALSILTAFAVNAQTRTDTTATTPAPAASSTHMSTDTKVPDTHSLDKKVVKEGEKTQKAAQDGKITSSQAAALDKHESNVARDIGAAKADGKVSGNEKSIIKNEVNINKDLRDEMKDQTKKNQKEVEKATK